MRQCLENEWLHVAANVTPAEFLEIRIWPLQMVDKTNLAQPLPRCKLLANVRFLARETVVLTGFLSEGVWALIPRSEFGHAANQLKSLLGFSCTRGNSIMARHSHWLTIFVSPERLRVWGL